VARDAGARRPLRALIAPLPRPGDVSYPFADATFTVTHCGRIWLVTFMHYDLGYFDDEVGRLEPIENPFGSKVLPMCSE